jgi:transcriptional regulator with XRE-family HTH domain
MWHENLLEIIKERKLTPKQIAEGGNLPEKTVTRVISGKTANPYIDTLDRFSVALNCSLSDILVGTKAVVGDLNLSTLQESLDLAIAEKETISAARDLALAENAILKDKVAALSAELDLTKMELKHKEEIIALHNYYARILSHEQRGSNE